KHRNRAPGQQGLRAGANLLGRNLDGNQIARKYRTCAGHADLLLRDGGKRQAGKCDCLLEFTSRPELSLRAARESGHNSMCQNGLKVLLRVTVRPKPKFQGRNWGIPVAGNYLCQIQFPVSGYILINRSASACSASASVTWKNVVCLGSPATTQLLRQRVPR